MNVFGNQVEKAGKKVEMTEFQRKKYGASEVSEFLAVSVTVAVSISESF